MIIAAWVGTGKSYLKKYSNILDLETTPFRWIYEKIDNYEDFKSSPNAKNKVKNPKFPKNYFDYLMNVKDNYDAVLIPVQSDIIDLLFKNKINFIGVFPNASLKDIYRKRYIARGNNQEFINHILDAWQEKYNMLINNNIKVIDIKKNQYLEDVLIDLNIIKK